MAKQSKDTVGTADAQSMEAVKADTAGLFSKEQILASAKFANRRDLLTVLLEDDRQYSIADVEKIMADWFKIGVK